MRFLIVLICILFFSREGSAQSLPFFDSVKTYPFKKINWKKYNWKELEPITSLFKEYNIVAVSDGSHFEGGIKDAQSMILKGLIDSNLINTIYLEASWIDMNRIQSILKEKGSAGIEEAAKYFGSRALEYWLDEGFLIYLADQVKNDKVRLVGFDIATTSSYRSYQMFKEAYELPVVRKMTTTSPHELKIIRNQYLLFNFLTACDLCAPKSGDGLGKAASKLISGKRIYLSTHFSPSTISMQGGKPLGAIGGKYNNIKSGAFFNGQSLGTGNLKVSKMGSVSFKFNNPN